MSQHPTVLAVLMLAGLVSAPAAAQRISAASSVVHVVAVTVPPRVQVKLSPTLSTQFAPLSNDKAPIRGRGSRGMRLTINGNQNWAVSVTSSAGVEETLNGDGSAVIAVPGSSGDGPVLITVSTR